MRFLYTPILFFLFQGLSAQCLIDSMRVEAYGCGANETFMVDIDFTVSNNTQDSFLIQGNGQSYGRFSYASLPVTLGPLPGNCTTEWEFVVKDIGNASCSNFVDLGNLCCTDLCKINNLTFETGECLEGKYSGNLNFNSDGSIGDLYDVFFNDELLMTIHQSDLPIHISSLQNGFDTYDKIRVCAKDRENCCQEISVLSPCICAIYDTKVEVLGCDESGNFSVSIDFSYQNTSSEGFLVGGNSNSYGTFGYDDLPIKIKDIPGNGQINYEFLIVDRGNAFCFDFENIGIVSCNSGDSCLIPSTRDDLKIDVLDCSDDGSFYVKLDFMADETDRLGFSVVGNGVRYGNYKYGELPITIGPLEGDCETIYEFVATDLENGDCSASVELEKVICCNRDCDFDQIIVNSIECTNDGISAQFVLSISVDSLNSGGFDLFSGETFFGAFTYEDLPLLVENFPVTEGKINVIVKQKDHAECSVRLVESVNCNPDDCSLSSMTYDIVPCVGDTAFQIQLNFDHNRGGDQKFIVRGNGQNYGQFSYGELPITISGLAADCEKIYEFIAIDSGNENCRTSIGLDDPICCTGLCRFSEITVSNIECADSTSIHFTLNFVHENPTNTHFDVIGDNGENIGYYAYADLPVRIKNFPLRALEFQFIRIQDNDNPDCTQAFEFVAPFCFNPDTCSISNVFAEGKACVEGKVLVDVQFDGGRTEGKFEIRGNGTSYGVFDYGQSFYTVGPVEANCEKKYEFIIIDQMDERCRGEFNFDEAFCCDSTAICKIEEIQILSKKCLNAELYSLVLDLNYSGISNQFFEVWSGQKYVGYYAFADLPVTIDSFPTRGLDFELIRVCQNDNLDCCLSKEFPRSNCMDEVACNFRDYTVSVVKCDGEGLFISIDLNYSQPSVAGFELYIDEKLWLSSTYDLFPIIVGPFEPSSDSRTWNIRVKDKNLSCQISEDLFIQPCIETATDDYDIDALLHIWYQNHTNHLVIKNDERLSVRKLELFDIFGRRIMVQDLDSSLAEHDIDISSIRQNTTLVAIIQTDQGRISKCIPIIRN